MFAGCAYKPRILAYWNPPDARTGMGQISSLNLQEELILVMPSYWTSGLLNWERINFCSLSLSVCGILLWQPWNTNTMTHGETAGRPVAPREFSPCSLQAIGNPLQQPHTMLVGFLFGYNPRSVYLVLSIYFKASGNVKFLNRYSTFLKVSKGSNFS